jgi:hypothetical protein
LPLATFTNAAKG